MKNTPHFHLKLFTAALAAGSAMSAAAFPIAAVGTEGSPVIASGPITATVVSTYEGNSASFSNDLYLELDGLGLPGMDGNTANDLFIFNNHGNTPGDTKALGNFADGTELIFRLFVNNTGENFYSGNALRNPDFLPHARVQGEWMPGTTLVSFEDLFGLPEGAAGFNDLSFSFSNTRTVGTPDAGATAALLALGFLGMAGAKRRRQV